MNQFCQLSFNETINNPGGASGQEPACQCRRCRFDPWVRKIPWRRKCQPTPEFLPGESHRQRSLVGYSPWGRKEWETTERTFVFELWCWKRLSRVPWMARRSNQPILKEISPEYSLKGLMLKLKLQSSGTYCEELTPWKRP